MLSVAGATVYQPADGTNVPDYLLARERIGGGCARCSTASPATAASRTWCDSTGGPTARRSRSRAARRLSRPGRRAGDRRGARRRSGGPDRRGAAPIAGRAARRRTISSPIPASAAGSSFTAEPAFARSVALAAGVVARGRTDGERAVRRRCGRSAPAARGTCTPRRSRSAPIKKGRIDLAETVSGLFETEAARASCTC